MARRTVLCDGDDVAFGFVHAMARVDPLVIVRHKGKRYGGFSGVAHARWVIGHPGWKGAKVYLLKKEPKR